MPSTIIKHVEDKPKTGLDVTKVKYVLLQKKTNISKIATEWLDQNNSAIAT